jgi:hypothetical protein
MPDEQSLPAMPSTTIPTATLAPAAQYTRAVPAAPYAMTQRGFVGGLMLAAVTIIATGDFLAGYAALVLCLTIGLTWRVDEAPILPFILTLQWIQITSGYFFRMMTGVTPADILPGDIGRAVQLALTGLIALAAGMRVVCNSDPVRDEEHAPVVGNLSGLFYLVIALYSINYISLIHVDSTGGLNIIIERLMMVRQIPLLLLWFEVLRQGRGRMYLWLSLVFVFLPALGSFLSDFKTPLFLALIVSASTWKPWRPGALRFTPAGALRNIALAAAVVFMALTWQAGVKGDTRKAYGTETIGSTPLERIQFFMDSAERAVPIVFSDTQQVVEALVSRVWYVVLFSRVLDYVPAFEPHAEGELLQLAVSNAVQPRLLFPSKPPLPSDTYYTRRFAGVALDDRLDTSISIGYMAEFYADWGLTGMFLSIFAYGALIGGAMRLVRRVTVGSLLANPAVITVGLTMAFFEMQFVKALGALMMSLIVTIGCILVFRKPFEQFLDLRPFSADED